ncbi:MAG: hypothetical protein LJE64_06570 [Desulfofustis sp.]|jgi:hypothetical protein|nr:hypothetical protein [Desulfofustis sp.]
MIKEDKKRKDNFFHVNNSLPNLFVDDIRVSIRNDNIATLNFFSDSPEGKFEQTRVTAKKERLKVFIDALCRHTGYYPVKPSEEKEEEKKKKK